MHLLKLQLKTHEKSRLLHPCSKLDRPANEHYSATSSKTKLPYFFLMTHWNMDWMMTCKTVSAAHGPISQPHILLSIHTTHNSEPPLHIGSKAHCEISSQVLLFLQCRMYLSCTIFIISENCLSLHGPWWIPLFQLEYVFKPLRTFSPHINNLSILLVQS